MNQGIRFAFVGRVMLGCALFLAVSSFAKPIEYQYVRVPIKTLTPQWVERTQFIRDHKWDDEFAFGYIPLSHMERISRAAKRELVMLDAKLWATQDHDAKTLLPLPVTAPTVAWAEDFHTYETLTAALKALAQKYPALATLESAGKSVEGRELWYLRLTAFPRHSWRKP